MWLKLKWAVEVGQIESVLSRFMYVLKNVLAFVLLQLCNRE